MYFEDISQFLYDFEIKGQRTLKLVKDITHNVRVRREILSNITLYDTYDYRDGDTPEIIAERVYGSAIYHWVVMLCNERLNYIDDFPLPTVEFEKHVRAKYGDVVELALTSAVLSSNVFKVASTSGLEAGWQIIFKQTGQLTSTESYIVSIDSPTQFTIADTVSVPISEQIVIDPVYGVHHYINLDGFIVDEWDPDGVPVSNYQYEDEVNESKRNIKLISPSLLNTILKNYKDLL